MGATGSEAVETQIPARLDRLPWSRWHWLVVVALGITWILDGLEVTIVGAIGAVLKEGDTLHLSSSEVGLAGSIYIAGAVTGALVFGYLTDRLGRKRLFMVTLALYVAATVATALAWGPWSFMAFRFLTGAGIGGEYSAINSAIDELIPARVRGWVDLAINGSWWVGTAAGAAATIPLLDPNLISHSLGWRLCFGLGAVLGLLVLVVRKALPESPRWLMTHGRVEEAEKIVGEIERRVAASTGEDLPEPEGSIEVTETERMGFITIAKTMFGRYPRRSVLGFSLMASQAFVYNAVFFSYGLVLTTFYNVPSGSVGYYILPFALGNFLGPLLLGRLFDSIGRRPMIAGSYVISGVLLAITGYLFTQHVLTATTQTIAWAVIFFFASAGASSAYLTVSEIFPLEIRAMAIAFFYAIATGAGGITGPVLFGALAGTKSRGYIYLGDGIAAALMVAAGVIELWLGVSAEQESLEDIATPLSATEEGTVDGNERHEDHPPEHEPETNDRGRPLDERPRRHRGVPASYRRVYSPRASFASVPLDEKVLALHVARIVGELANEGSLTRHELATRVGARRWGPGQLTHALRIARQRGYISHAGRDRYAAAQRSQPSGAH
ncbi:MAG TPA: MFS transporter [Gaiellaceae bacterium]